MRSTAAACYDRPVSPRSQASRIERIARRVHAQAIKMIYDANHRDDAAPGDPKIGGHPASSSSSVHILAALHLGVRTAADVIASKPHASPVDHAINHLLGLLHDDDGWLDAAASAKAMSTLRQHSFDGSPVFQSYHAPTDPDGYWYLPAGSVGIPAVVSAYTALAYRFARDHGHRVPDGAHFWSLMGDAELREGSLGEAMPDIAERELGEVTWIVDYNRQNLDGPRIGNRRGVGVGDADRIARTFEANGWRAVQLRHGELRKQAFKRKGGAALRAVLEDGLSDFALQMLLMANDGARARAELIAVDKKVKAALKPLSDVEVIALLGDLGGHDVAALIAAFSAARKPRRHPLIIIAHTIKGWGLECAASSGNHSALPNEAEVARLLRAVGLTSAAPFDRFDPSSDEGALLAERGQSLRDDTEALWQLRDDNRALADEAIAAGLPDALGLNLSFVPSAHTQYAWGQLAAKLIRLGSSQDELTGDEARWAPVAANFVTMSPDVGTSTNINAAMDGRVYAPEAEPDWQAELDVVDRRRPRLAPTAGGDGRHLRFDIAEANVMCAAGAFGKLGDRLGIPLAPVMTVYDFFIKRAYDQLYYNLYWGSRFVIVGTPSGVTLSPEGAQHSWKTDIQMPNVISWEPFFAQEIDWILADTLSRHRQGDDAGRQGVIIRGVPRAFETDHFLDRLRVCNPGCSDGEILEATRSDVLAGGYYLVDHRGREGYEPAENVVQIFALGAMAAEALIASDRLAERGILANVIVVTCADLLCGSLGRESGYNHLRRRLGVDGDLHLTAHGGAIEDRADYVLAGGRRVPIVAVVDGEPGLLDNLGSVVGVRCETLAVRVPSKCGRPQDVYGRLEIDAQAIFDACGHVLADTAREDVAIRRSVFAQPQIEPLKKIERLDLWP